MQKTRSTLLDGDPLNAKTLAAVCETIRRDPARVTVAVDAVGRSFRLTCADLTPEEMKRLAAIAATRPTG